MQPARRHWLVLSVGVVALAAASVAIWHWLHPLPKLRDIERRIAARQWELADAAATEYVTRRPRDADGLTLAARVAAGRGERERCVKLLERVPHDSPLKTEALFGQALALQELNYGQRQERAWLELIRVATRTQGQRSALRMRAQEELVPLYFLERRAEDARALVWEMYPTHREKWRLLVTLARIEGKPASAAQARPVLERFVDRDLDDLPARRALARYALDDHPDDAAELAKQCLELDPSDAASLEILLEAYMRLNRWHDMEPILTRSDLGPERSRMWRLRGQWHLAQGQTAEAETAFRTALRIDPYDPTAQYQLGQALRRGTTIDEAQYHILHSNALRKRLEDITTFLNTFVNEDPQTWQPPAPGKCAELADNCSALGRRDEARGWLEEALRQQPEFTAAREALNELNRPE